MTTLPVLTAPFYAYPVPAAITLTLGRTIIAEHAQGFTFHEIHLRHPETLSPAGAHAGYCAAMEHYYTHTPQPV